MAIGITKQDIIDKINELNNSRINLDDVIITPYSNSNSVPNQNFKIEGIENGPFVGSVNCSLNRFSLQSLFATIDGVVLGENVASMNRAGLVDILNNQYDIQFLPEDIELLNPAVSGAVVPFNTLPASLTAYGSANLTRKERYKTLSKDIDVRAVNDNFVPRSGGTYSIDTPTRVCNYNDDPVSSELFKTITESNMSSKLSELMSRLKADSNKLGYLPWSVLPNAQLSLSKASFVYNGRTTLEHGCISIAHSVLIFDLDPVTSTAYTGRVYLHYDGRAL